MYSAISQNKRKTWLVMTVFVIIIGGIGLLVGALYKNYSLSAVVLLMALLYAWLQYFIAGKLAMAYPAGKFPCLGKRCIAAKKRAANKYILAARVHADHQHSGVRLSVRSSSHKRLIRLLAV